MKVRRLQNATYTHRTGTNQLTLYEGNHSATCYRDKCHSTNSTENQMTAVHAVFEEDEASSAVVVLSSSVIVFVGGIVVFSSMVNSAPGTIMGGASGSPSAHLVVVPLRTTGLGAQVCNSAVLNVVSSSTTRLGLNVPVDCACTTPHQ
jgi:hypothetical protein